MDGDALQQRARNRVNELPGADLEHPFGPEWEVFKVRNKVFLLMTERNGAPVVTVKVDPEDGKALCEQYAGITPGYHMNKRHWITVYPDGGVPASLLEDLVTESYLLVVGRLPRAKRPVDPALFGDHRSQDVPPERTVDGAGESSS
ncbi:MmcQ/YjbR family DNA-binding protein [Microbacterium sp. cx-55]|uniref:MmcQ/YjbR family DNA-binding protein n=1 Tax=Microbacterium sp. cx-55 TaxID=2875948 RepID=UPI001CBE0447|nr:MmcQ/YjbR family DNA-binding protein [Microbacterium sp. cx-55]MBZ4487120.1 MmcQ/YjbR family DNA-binding protein [Microbacterium sp. cx-55]UGB35156.1 MmcQ/YjbR family DNA-binding protein [Microbacterium sp. cx-55]